MKNVSKPVMFQNWDSVEGEAPEEIVDRTTAWKKVSQAVKLLIARNAVNLAGVNVWTELRNRTKRLKKGMK